MATKSTNVTPGKVVSATVRYSNSTNPTRAWDIEADVNVSNGEISSFNSGEVKKSGEENGFNISNFNASGSGLAYFNIGFNNVTKEEAKAIFDDVLSFMNDVEENIKSQANTPKE